MLVSSTPSGPWSTCNNAHTINCTNPFSTFVTTTGPHAGQLGKAVHVWSHHTSGNVIAFFAFQSCILS